MRHYFFEKQHLILAAALICLPAAAPPAQEGGALEEIIVTAQHREQNVQDVPISVTALGAAQIEAGGIVDATSVAFNVPGLSFAQFAPGQAYISFRGVTSVDDSAGLDNSAATFLDGVYIGRHAGIDFDLFDIERIEALKGPQGTLFGRNAIGGVLNVVTKRPTEEFVGKASVTVGNYDTLRFQGLVSGGVEGLAGKLSVNHREHDGYVRNTLLNKDIRDGNRTSVRGQVAISGDRASLLLSADSMEDNMSEGLGRFPLDNGNADYIGFARMLGADRDFTNASPTDGFSYRENRGISLQGDMDVIGGTATVIAGLRGVESEWWMPSVGAPLGGTSDFLDADNMNPDLFGGDVIDDIDEEVDTFSAEARYTSDFDGAFNFVAGLYYFNEDTYRREQFRIDRMSVSRGQFVVGNEWTLTENETDSYAFYAQANYDLNDQLRFTLGGRYTYDKRDFHAAAVNCGIRDDEGELDNSVITDAGLSVSACTFNGTRVAGSLRIIPTTFNTYVKKSWNDFSPMGSVQYRMNDEIMFYTTVSTGYKAGGFAGSQGREDAARTPLDQENVINFEGGVKSDLLDRTLRVNMTGFYMDYTDLQVVRFGPVPGSDFGEFRTTNAGDAEIYGLEMDFVWHATEQIRVSGSYAWLESKVQDLFLPGCPGAEAADTTQDERDFRDGDFIRKDCSGLPLRQSPEHTWSLVAEYNFPIEYGELDFRGQWTHVDENHHDYATESVTVTETHNLLDLSATWTSTDGHYKLTLWAKNLTDAAYSTHSYRIGPGTIGAWGDPRTYGVTATYSY